MGIPRAQVEHLLKGKLPVKAKKRHKYGVAPKAERTFDGHVFHSKKEKNRFYYLNSLRIAGVIRCLVCQPMIRLPGGVKYYADFAYECIKFSKWEMVIEDCKGFKTEAYRLKKKQVEAIYGIKILET
jgi:uncharacterized protein DUF1064